VALTPFDGLLEVVPHPSALVVWKEALLAVVVAARFVAPAEAQGAPGRRLPPWAAGVGFLFGLGLVSAMTVGGNPGLIGVRSFFSTSSPPSRCGGARSTAETGTA